MLGFATTRIRPLTEEINLHACTLVASYAVKHGVTSLRWKKVETYAWS